MKKRGIAIPALMWILIAVGFLVLGVIIIYILEKNGISVIDKIKSLLRGFGFR